MVIVFRMIYFYYMKFKNKAFLFLVFVVVCLGFFHFTSVSAHEVYVLNHDEIARDVAQPPLNLFEIAGSEEALFFTSVMFGILIMVIVLGISLSRKLERILDPLLFKIKPYASYIAQITIGSALFASAYTHDLFGTELPFSQLFGHYAGLVTIVLYAASILILFGIYSRIGGLCVLVVFIGAMLSGTGLYMISYLTYFAEGLILFLFGGGYTFWGDTNVFEKSVFMKELKKRSSFILRVCFSTSLIYAAFYAKFIHGALALDTVNKYHLTNYFHFQPLFIVLGAFLIEISIGLFYLIGFEIRFTSLFFLTFLTMSLVFFGETIWPHIMLIGTATGLFVHGYDEYTIERRWYIHDKKEPVL